MSYLQDSKDAELLKQVIEYMTRKGMKVLTVNLAQKTLRDLHNEYNLTDIRNANGLKEHQNHKG